MNKTTKNTKQTIYIERVKRTVKVCSHNGWITDTITRRRTIHVLQTVQGNEYQKQQQQQQQQQQQPDKVYDTLIHQ